MQMNFKPLITNGELAVFTITIIGSLMDLTTTAIGLALPGIIETNPFVVQRMSEGTWLIFDAICAICVMSSVWLAIRFNNPKYRYVFLASPLIYGAWRAFCAINNIIVIYGVLYG